MKVFGNLSEFVAAAGSQLGPTEWMEITQDRVNLFADATDDHQFIHCDPERAARETPFGGTIAHGFLTLSLLPEMAANAYDVADRRMGVNYGLNKVRFPAPLPVDSLVRVRLGIAAVEDVPDGVQVVWLATVERQGGDKPVCVAESITRLYF